MQIRHDWTRDEIRGIFNLPLPELIFQAQTIHREFHKPGGSAALPLAFDKNGRVSRGLRLLFAERALQNRRRPAKINGAGRRS